MCPHLPACPDAQTPGRMAARAAADHPGQGRSLLCNGVALFEDGGALPADGPAGAPPGPAVRPAAGEAPKTGMTKMVAGE
jgi:hypothetical protein